MNPKSQPGRLTTLDALRGLAALAVSWWHFTNGNVEFLNPGWLKSSGSLGWLGVEIFFVISGFVIPYSLHRTGYTLTNYGTFLLKRIVRLDPPYLLAIVLVFFLNYCSTLAPGYRGFPFVLSWVQVALHLCYLNVFFGFPWILPVFWTLAIEFQYYLIMGLLFFLIAHRRIFVRLGAYLGLGLLAFLLPADQFLFHWLFLFMLGMAAFQLHLKLLSQPQFLLGVLLFGGGAWFLNGPSIAVTGVGTALLLGWCRSCPFAPLLLLGNLSYSLYLLHMPIGGRVINLSLRFVHSTPGKIGVLLCATTLSILAAWLFHKYVEQPAQRWSSAIRYRKKAES